MIIIITVSVYCKKNLILALIGSSKWATIYWKYSQIKLILIASEITHMFYNFDEDI